MRLHLALTVLLLSVSTGVARAAQADAPKPDQDGWYQLFNGQDLTGWKLSKSNQDSIRVEDGAIVTNGPACHAFYDGPVENHNFKNFQWKCEIMTKPNSNSGMYFHTKYQAEGWPSKGIEIQVNNSHSDRIRTGSLYRLHNVMDKSPAKDNEWFTQEVIVEGNKVTVKVNDKVINEYTQPEDLKREEGWEDAVVSSGTFALQAHDPGSEVHYRKVMVKPLP